MMKFVIRHSGNPHPPSFPYISGDSFRHLASHRYERGTYFDPYKVDEKDVIFVEGDLIKTFFEMVHPRITHRYILISHNTDDGVDGSYLKYMDRKIIHWFAQNVLTHHPKITPIPIGLEGLYHYNCGVPSIFDSLVKNNDAVKGKKKNRIFFGFSIETNRHERQKAYNFLIKYPLSERLSGWPYPKKYFSIVQSYKFIASPRGNGEDCIRTWESMLLETVPIVMRSTGIDSFAKLGLPLLVIDSWDELSAFSEYDLQAKYDLITAKANREPLYMDYWRKLILSKQQ